MKISACYIVKNEANTLPESLASVADAVDELVVVDTGSTDGTRAVAEKYGAKIVDFPWQGDFAAARNRAIDNASGDWILFLDADEYFTPETRGNLRQTIEHFADYEALAMCIVNIDVDDDEPKIIDHAFVIRAFRRLPNIRYHRRIHEYLLKQGPPLKMGAVDRETITIYHTGYTPGRSPQKARRNLELLLAELKTTDKPETLYRYLAESYDGLGDRAKAIEYAKMDIAGGPREVIYASRCYRMLLLRLPPGEERDGVLREAVKYFPKMPEFHAELGERKAADLDFVSAVKEMELAVKTYREHIEDGEGMQFNDEMLEKAEVRLTLFRAIKEKMAKIKICACCIAKNEAAELPTWLDNVAKFADEVWVLDTGSDDDTKKIAQNAGAIVCEYLWQDDFAAARNYLLTKIEKRHKGNRKPFYIAFLDADETFFAPDKVRALLAKSEVVMPKIVGLVLPRIDVDADAYDLEISRSDVLRIWRHNPGYRYEGRIHEALYDRGKPPKNLGYAAEPAIRHTGLSSRRVRAKLVRNLKLLNRQAAEGKATPLYNRYMADCCYGLKEYELAIHYAKAAINDKVDALDNGNYLYRLLADSLRAVGSPLSEQLAVVEAGLKRSLDDVALMALRGSLLRKTGQNDKALSVLREFYQVYETKGGNERSDVIISALVDLAALDSANRGKYLKEALTKNPFAASALALKVDSWDKDANELVDELLEFYSDKEKGAKFLRHWSEENGRLGLYWLLSERLGISSAEIYDLAAAGQVDETGNMAFTEAGTNITALFRALLGLDETMRLGYPERVDEWRKLLPTELSRLLARCWGELDKLTEGEWDIFWLGLNEANKTEREMPLALAACDFAADKVIAAADFLWDKHRWAAAFELYSQVPADALTDPGKFWYRVGVTLFHLRQYETALECLNKAQALNFNSRDIPAFIKWAAEKNDVLRRQA